MCTSRKPNRAKSYAGYQLVIFTEKSWSGRRESNGLARITLAYPSGAFGVCLGLHALVIGDMVKVFRNFRELGGSIPRRAQLAHKILLL